MEELRHKLIVSCQALPDEPLHSDFIMARMAVAAEEGGASGIRANSVVDHWDHKTRLRRCRCLYHGNYERGR